MNVSPDDDGQAADRRPARARLLVAMPNRSHAQLIARRLSESGYRVLTAATVTEAVAEMYRSPIDLVAAELASGDFDGVELVQNVRRDTAICDVPVLLLAAKADHPLEVKALGAGADAIVRKPFQFEVLVARIARELERKSMVDELRCDNRRLDERVTRRAIELGDLKDRLAEREAEVRRLQSLLSSKDPG